MASVTTHKGGPFYEWYVSVYGYAPPPSVDDQACRYIAWQRGWSHAIAQGIPYGTIGNCDIYLLGAAGGALATPPPPPPPVPSPISTAGSGLTAPTAPPQLESAPPPAAPVATTASAGLTIAGVDYSALQVEQMKAIYRACLDKKVNARVQQAAFTIGVAENGWDPNTCNSSDHCGVFQLDSDWQAKHDYRDTYYWCIYALEQGFYSRGGLIHIDAANPNYTIGEIVEACQGAGPTFAEASTYYDGRVPEAANILGYFIGHRVDVSGIGVTSSPPAVAARPAPSAGGVYDLFGKINWAGDFENLWKYVQGGSNEAANMAKVYNENTLDRIDFINWPH